MIKKLDDIVTILNSKLNNAFVAYNFDYLSNIGRINITHPCCSYTVTLLPLILEKADVNEIVNNILDDYRNEVLGYIFKED